jgi:aminomethyltransferase
MTASARHTALFELHAELGGRMADFAGFALPTMYDGAGALSEHLHTRSKCSWFDVSHMVVCDVIAPDAAAMMERLTPSLLDDLAVGSSRYCVLTNEHGGSVDDTIVTRRADGVRLVLNAACADNDLAHLQAHLGASVRPRYDLGIIALQGPTSAHAIASIDATLDRLAFMQSTTVTWQGVSIDVARSGYTGEDGFELTAPTDSLVALSRALLAQPDVAPAGLAARDSLRLEAGLCLYGNELGPDISPVEAGLLWTIPKTRREGGEYLGAAAIAATIASGPNRRLVGIAARGKRPIRAGAVLHSADADQPVVGHVSSGGWSATLGKPVALGFTSGAHAVGTELLADVRGQLEPCDIVARPFVPHRYVRPAA